MLKTLSVEEADATETFEACRYLLSPIRRLPAEILSAIFIACLPKDLYIIPSRRRAPLILSQVCSSWRTIASSTVRYTNLRRGATGKSKDIDRIHASMMNLWLSRVAALPLSISVECSRMRQPIIDVLLHYSSQCQHLRLRGIRSWNGISIPNGIFPNIETLSVQSFT